ncbi:MAG: type-F conjugative transfer system pilin assembly protein TrbC [Geobacteraceae bacterium]
MTRLTMVTLLVGTTLLSASFPATAVTSYIETSDLCSQVEKVEGGRVYLVSKGMCPKVAGKVAVTLEKGIEEVEVYLDGAFWKRQKTALFDIDALGGLNERGERLSRALNLPKNIFEKDGEKWARASDDLFRSGEFQNRLLAEQERIKREVFGGKLQEYYQAAPEAAAAMAGELPRDERVYIFISSSMPKRTLRNYVRDVAKLGDPNVKLVMRGLVGGMKYLKPTLRFVGSLLVKDEECDPQQRKCERLGAGVEIDPLLFRRYGIERVPAIVFARKVNVLDAQMSEGLERNMAVAEFHVLNGDMALEYALERFRTETGSAALGALITRLNSGFYGGGKR